MASSEKTVLEEMESKSSAEEDSDTTATHAVASLLDKVRSPQLSHLTGSRKRKISVNKKGSCKVLAVKNVPEY